MSDPVKKRKQSKKDSKIMAPCCLNVDDYEFKNNSKFKISLRTIQIWSFFPTEIYSFKASNGNTRTIREICSKLTIKTPDQRD